MIIKPDIALATLTSRLELVKEILASKTSNPLVKQSAIVHATSFAYDWIIQDRGFTTSDYLDLVRKRFSDESAIKFYDHLIGYCFFSADSTKTVRNERLVSILTVDYPELGIFDKGIGAYDTTILSDYDNPWNFS